MKRALLIGINYFNTNNELFGCINDVKDVKEYLESVGFNEFRMLVDDKDDIKHLNENAPTYENIINAINHFINITEKGDTLYIHYSGHGTQINDDNGDERDLMDECICPVDDTIIRDDELSGILMGLKDGAKLRVVFDSCHSGSACDLNPILKTNKDIVYISGCRDNQYSADTSFNNRANGALTWAFLDTLKSRRGLTWRHFVKILEYQLRKYGQTPQLTIKKNRYVDL